MHIRKAEEKDIPELSKIMALAFAGEAFNRWVFGDEKTAIERGQKLFALLGRRFINEGYFLTTEDKKAVILCVPPDSAKASFLKDMGLMFRMALIFRTKMIFMLGIFKQMEIMKPKEPHFYIEVLGVDPSVQRGGLGRALMNHVLGICDQNGWLAYLENPEHLVPYYESFGFKVRATHEVPKVGITMYTMTRTAEEKR